MHLALYARLYIFYHNVIQSVMRFDMEPSVALASHHEYCQRRTFGTAVCVWRGEHTVLYIYNIKKGTEYCQEFFFESLSITNGQNVHGPEYIFYFNLQAISKR